MQDHPLYRSLSSIKSLWQEYRVYADHVEFATHFGLISVPFDQIERADVSESEVKGLLKGRLHLKNFRPALKLDWANFVEHVVLDKKSGRIRRLLFTPDSPGKFTAALNEALSKHRESKKAR